MKNIFSCIMILIGTLIGAGFASGQEIAIFFNRFMNKGLLGIIFDSLLFGIIIFCVMSLCQKHKFKSYGDLIDNNKFVMLVMKIFSFVCFCIMISAVGAYGVQQCNVSFWYGAIIAGLLCFLVFLLKFNGLEKINSILVPLILVGIFILGFHNYGGSDIIFEGNIQELSIFTNDWLLSAILYVGYNSILLIPILAELNKYKMGKKDVLLLSILTCLLLGNAGILVFRSINIFFPRILYCELPALILANACGKIIRYYYSVVIVFAIFTTAFSCGYSFLRMNSEEKYLRNTCLMCIIAVVLSKIGFTKLVNFCFPFFGVLGILQIFFIFLHKKKED